MSAMALEHKVATRIETAVPMKEQMCIRDSYDTSEVGAQHAAKAAPDGMNLTVAACTNMDNYLSCLLYTSRCV